MALANTIVGVVTLAGGLLGFIGDAFGIRLLIALFIVLALLGVIMSWQMPEADALAK